MAEYLAPGVFVEEIPSGNKPIEGVGTSTAAFLGVARRGPIGQPTLITNLAQFYATFGDPLPLKQRHYLGYAVEHFFNQGGARCYVSRTVHYTDPLDGTTLTAHKALRDFNDASDPAVPVLRVSARDEGEWGLQLRVSIRNSSRLMTLLAQARAAGTFDRLTVTDVTGIEPGTTLWLVQPIFATVAGNDGTLTLDRDSLILEGETDAIADSTTIAANALVLTPDFRYMARLTADLTLDASDPAPTLENLTEGVAVPSGSSADPSTLDVDNQPVQAGEVLWIVEPSRSVQGIVKRTEVNTETQAKTVIFNDDLTTTQAFPASSRLIARDFTINVRLGSEEVERFPNLTMVDDHKVDWVESRVNLGGERSRFITVEDLTETASNTPMSNRVYSPLQRPATVTNLDGLAGLARDDYIGSPAGQNGLYAFDAIDDASILAIPYPNVPQASRDADLKGIYDQASAYCERRKDLFLVIDCKPTQTPQEVRAFKGTLNASNYAAFYYPWIKVRDPATRKLVAVPVSGAVAGAYAATDIRRGVHKAAAGTLDGRLTVASGIERIVTKGEHDTLNNQGIGVIRSFTEAGLVIWGARTIASDAEWRYINVRRLFLFLEKSIELGTQWAVFEPNGSVLWQQIERNVSAFLRTVWRSGALFGNTEQEAFYVKCNAETNPPESIALGRVVTEIGVAPVKPAEFVIFRISQGAAGSTISE